ncbi:MAG: GTP-binding protein [Pelodictyon luteolum]|uniref:Probable GTP-binding protein EngB n=1 Tax=Pelodictyon luteolum TaxID=1100 RepID=A0A165LAF6_PELLU|nr:ribosome biogenesis GTP-binding protein YihA/YsxC [Pelodictyon luteolum]KZK73781.1 MAG: GTP-binding protein [Pelodictyon luteolum]
MKIINAAFFRSVSSLSDLPEESFPEIVFAGRSNVGKSSLLNSLTGRKGLAKTSSTPGKTRLINYFLINDDLYFVDIPGYGYAAVSHAEKDAWGRLLAGYVGGRRAIVLVVLLLDARHPAMQSDREMMKFLAYHDRPYGIVLTKDDKLTQKERAQAKRSTESYALDAEFIVMYSSLSGKGRKELLAHFGRYRSEDGSGAGSEGADLVT